MNRLRRPRVGRTVIAALVAAGAVLTLVASAGPTVADETTDEALAALKSRLTHRIELRLTALERLEARLDGARHLSDEHRDALGALIAEDTAALTELKTKVESETTRDALRADAKSMVVDYRVFILVRPEVRLVIVADRELAAIARLGDVHDKLADLVEQAEADGDDVGNAAELLDAMQSQLDAAADGVAGQVDRLLALEPGPDGPAIRSAVDEIREALRGARQDLRDAVTTAKGIRALLRGHR